MNIEAIDQSAEIDTVDQKIAALRQMTAEQLLCLGKRQVAYLKVGLREDGLVFVLCGADGGLIEMSDNIEEAAEMAARSGLELISVH